MATPATPATTPATSSALELTLDPVPSPTFLEEHWDRAPLRVPRDAPGRFDAVLSRADAERLICASGLRAPAFRLVRDGAPLPLSTYTEDIPWRPGVLSQTARPGRVAEEFAAGATVVLQALHVHWHPAALYCRGLEIALGCPVQANAYLTPSSAQGFAVHHDTHDVFVLQVAGSKRWRVYAPVRELPLPSQRWSASLGDPGEPVDDFVLAPGDTLYLPRGWPHEAFTSDGDSLHVTVGLHPPTRLDALRAAVADCGDDVELRRALTVDGDLPGDVLERLAARLGPGAVAARARRRFVATRRAILPDQLTQVAALRTLTADTPVERRPTVIADLQDGVLLFEGKEVRLPEQAWPAAAFAFDAARPFRPRELPGLDASGRLVLVRRLVREGFLRIAGEGGWGGDLSFPAGPTGDHPSQ